MGALWFLVTQRLAGEGLGRAVPACLVLTFVCLVLALIDATTGLLPDRITYPAFPVVGSLLLGASLRLGDLGRLGCVCLGRPPWAASCSCWHRSRRPPLRLDDVKLASTPDLALGWLSWER
jgi:hypothetical protein